MAATAQQLSEFAASATAVATAAGEAQSTQTAVEDATAKLDAANAAHAEKNTLLTTAVADLEVKKAAAGFLFSP